MSKKKSIAFVGMSHLGLCYSATAAEKGFKVVAFDESKNKINSYKNLEIDIHEKNLNNLIKKNINKNLFFDSNFDNLKKCRLVFLSLDVPTDSNGSSDIIFIKKFVKKIIKKISQNNCTLILLSQIPPGFTSLINWPKHRLYYQVETLIFGNAVERALKPERIIVGSYKKKIICKNYKFFLSNFKCPIINLNYESAELAKTAINLFLISQVSTTNFLASISEKIGADWSSIVPSLKLDKRIGKYSYLNPGLGLSGGNLERDLKTLDKISHRFNNKDKILKSLINSSRIYKMWVFDKLKTLKLNTSNKISILGLSYKENTSSIKNSPAINLIKKIKNFENIVGYDPKADLLKFKQNNFLRSFTLDEALQNSEVLIIMTKWEEFKKISIKTLNNKMTGKIIIDPYGFLEKLNFSSYGYLYYKIGN